MFWNYSLLLIPLLLVSHCGSSLEKTLLQVPYVIPTYDGYFTIYHNDIAIGESKQKLVYYPMDEGIYRYEGKDTYTYTHRIGEQRTVTHQYQVSCTGGFRLLSFFEYTEAMDQVHAYHERVHRSGRFDYQRLHLSVYEKGEDPKEREIHLYLNPYCSLIVEYLMLGVLNETDSRRWVRFFNCGNLAFQEETIYYLGIQETKVHDTLKNLIAFKTINNEDGSSLTNFYDQNHQLQKQIRSYEHQFSIEWHRVQKDATQNNDDAVQ